MSKITTIGLDLAKNVFHVVCCDRHGKVIRKKLLKRAQLRPFFGNLTHCLVGMEACASAHHWARELECLGHQVKLIPPQYVKPYVRGNKNDYNDALAIAEAVTRPQMRWVSIKTTEQQDMQALYRLRERRIQERTALCNQLRGLLAEYGVILPRGVNVVRRRLPELLEEVENGLSDFSEAWCRRATVSCRNWISISGFTRSSWRPTAQEMRPAADSRRSRDMGRSWRVCSTARSGTGVATAGGAMFRPRWGWFRASTAVEGRMCCWVSASGGTGTCAACWCMVLARWSSRRPGKRTD